MIALRSRVAKPVPKTKTRKRTIAELEKDGVRIALKQWAGSSTSMIDDDGLRMQPYKGEWLLSHRGVALGSIKKKKAGWDLSGTKGMSSAGGYGEGLEKVQKATRLLDEYYAVGGK